MTDGPSSLVDAAVARLSEAEIDRFVAEYEAFMLKLGNLLALQKRGIKIAPNWNRELSDLLQDEATRRTLTGDPTAIAWGAFANEVRRTESETSDS